jgi:hypothetical protein
MVPFRCFLCQTMTGTLAGQYVMAGFVRIEVWPYIRNSSHNPVT